MVVVISIDCEQWRLLMPLTHTTQSAHKTGPCLNLQDLPHLLRVFREFEIVCLIWRYFLYREVDVVDDIHITMLYFHCIG